MKRTLLLLFTLLCLMRLAQAQAPNITLSTDITVGSTITIVVRTAAATTIKVDFGDGTQVEKSVSTIGTTITSALIGSQTVKLYGATITYFDCKNNQVTALDVSNAPLLTTINCKDNKLTVLDISTNTALQSLYCQNNKLTTLNATTNTALLEIHAQSNQLDNLLLPASSTLKMIECQDNNLSAVDISKCSVLNYLICLGNRLTFETLPSTALNWQFYNYTPQQAIPIIDQIVTGNVLDLSNQHIVGTNATVYIWKTKAGATLVEGTDYTIAEGKTTFLKAQTDSVYCEMTNTSFPNFSDLNVLKTTNVVVTEPEPDITLTTARAIGKVIELTFQDAPENTPIQVDFGNGVKIDKKIGPSSITIKGTIVESQTIKIYGEGFKFIDFRFEEITSIDLSNCEELEYVDLYSNKLKNIDLTNNTNLKILSIGYNSLKTLDVSKNTILYRIRCANNSLTSLDFSANKLLTEINCNNNLITSIYVETCPNLTFLDCAGNQISSLDISKNTKLLNLVAGSNKLSTIDLSQNVALLNIDLNNNQFSAIDISKNTALKTPSLNKNFLTFLSLPTVQATYTSYIYAPQNPMAIANSIEPNTVLDLSAVYSVVGNITVYVWKTKSGKTLEEGTDYTITEGKTTFLKGQWDSVYCEMSNASFPDFSGANILRTTSMKVEGYVKQTQTIAFSALPSPLEVGKTYQLSATTNTELPVTFTSSNEAFASISGSTLTVMHSGTFSITATQAGNDTLVAIDSVQTFTVAKPLLMTLVQTKSFYSNFYVTFKANQIEQNSSTILITYDDTDQMEFNYIDGYFSSIAGKYNTLRIYGDEITEISCTGHNLTSVKIEPNTSLVKLILSDNELSVLDVSGCANLQTLQCDKNMLTTLDLSKNTALQTISCKDNYFYFSTLPTTSANSFSAAPQHMMQIDAEIAIKGVLDLSKQYSIQGNITSYLWKTITGETLVEGTDYTISEGKTTFLKAQPYGVYCEMTNASFPDFTGENVLKTTIITVLNNVLTTQTIDFPVLPDPLEFGKTYELLATASSKLPVTFSSSDESVASVSGSTLTINRVGNVTITATQAGNDTLAIASAQQSVTTTVGEPNIVMTTEMAVGEEFVFYLNAKDENSPVYVDFGNGIFIEQIVGTLAATVSGKLVGSSVVKIYTLNIIKLKCPYSLLTDLSFSGCETLQYIECEENKLSSIDVSKLSDLIELRCFTNFLESLDVSNNIKLEKLFCGKNLLTKLDVSKNTELNTLFFEHNQISSLDISSNSKLLNLACNENKFVFSEIPQLFQYGEFFYSPQDSLPISKDIAEGSVLDLSSEYSVGGNTTVYTWISTSGDTLVAGTDYSIAEGKTTFLHTRTDSVFCAMTNETFPNLSGKNALKTTVIRILEKQSVTFVALPATLKVGKSYTLSASASTGEAVTFTSSDPSVASITGTKLTIHKAGTVTISATVAGNDLLASATETQTFTIKESVEIVTIGNETIRVYPTLASDQLFVKGNVSKSNAMIYNIAGTVVWSGSLNNEGINVSNFASGSYLLVIEDNSSSKKSTVWFVKQ